MGGPGSTRWNEHTPKPLVEQAISLDFLHPIWKEAFSQPRAQIDGHLEWRHGTTGALAGWADFYLSPVQPTFTRRLVLDRTGDDYEPKQIITLVPVQVGFSGRMYAKCPDKCGRLARKLYEVPGSREFACRRCAGLEYESVRRNDKRINRCRRDPATFLMRREFMSGWRSPLITLRIFEEARRRGTYWHSAKEARMAYFGEVPPELQGPEPLPADPIWLRKKLPKRYDRRARRLRQLAAEREAG